MIGLHGLHRLVCAKSKVLEVHGFVIEMESDVVSWQDSCSKELVFSSCPKVHAPCLIYQCKKIAQIEMTKPYVPKSGGWIFLNYKGLVFMGDINQLIHFTNLESWVVEECHLYPTLYRMYHHRVKLSHMMLKWFVFRTTLFLLLCVWMH